MVNFDICKGNPEALTFLIDAYKVDMFGAEIAFKRMQDNDITGDKLYMLWNDCCDRDTKKTISIMTKHTIKDILQHINYENGRGIKYIENIPENIPPNESALFTQNLSDYKPYGDFILLDIINPNDIEEAKNLLFKQCLDTIELILQENIDKLIYIEKDNSKQHLVRIGWKIMLPTGEVKNA